MNTAVAISQRLDEFLLSGYKALDTPGLFKGKMGACLYFFHRSCISTDSRFSTAAENTLEDVYSYVHENPIPTYFDNGLAGIAWGIHQLMKEGFVDGHADVLLERLDDILFKVISEKTDDLEFGVKRGLLGYLVYVLDRVNGIPEHPRRHRSKDLFTSLAVLIINRLHLMAETGTATFTEPKGFYLFWDLPVYLWVLAEAEKLAVHTDKVQQMKKDLTTTVLSCLPRHAGNRMNLYGAMKKTGIAEWDQHAALLKESLSGMGFSTFGLANKALNIENGLAGLILLDKYIRSDAHEFNGYFDQKEFFHGAKLHLESSEYWTDLNSIHTHELGLLYGFTGIAFALMSLAPKAP